MGGSRGHAATRVLVVDDEPSIRLLCRVNLELDGHEVLEAHSLATARAALVEEDVDVVVLDVHLRGERSDALLAEGPRPRAPTPGRGAARRPRRSPSCSSPAQWR